MSMMWAVFLSTVLAWWLCCCLVQPVAPTTSLPLPSIAFQPFEFSQPFRSYDFASNSVNTNLVIHGFTLQIVIEDCTIGARWFLAPGLAASNEAVVAHNFSLWILANITYDPALCALFVGVRSGYSLTIGGAIALMQSVWFYDAVASPVAANSLSTLRVVWTYWIDQTFVVSTATYQHMYFCLAAGDTTRNYGSAVQACQVWMQDPADPASIGATLVALTSPRVENMIDFIRRQVSDQYVDSITNLVVGYVHLIGIFGGRSSWDNGLPLSYTNFAAANPAGSFPTVIDQTNQWKSVLSADAFPYCCESTATGSAQQSTNGFAQLQSSSEAPANAAMTSVVVRMVKSTSTPNFDDFFPFASVPFPTSVLTSPSAAASPSSTAVEPPVYGLTVSIHMEDCDGSFRFVVPEQQQQPQLFEVLYLDDICSVQVWIANSNSSNATASLAALARQIRVMDVRGSIQSADSLTQNLTRRFVWGFLFGDRTPWVVNFSPVPHYYVCSWGSYNFADAAVLGCGGAQFEGYLATPQYRWEQTLLEGLVSRGGNLTLDSVWIGLDTQISTSAFANGDPILSYTNWGVNQPSTSMSSAALSSIDLNWVSTARSSTHSYCCERTAVPSRNASGVVTASLLSIPNTVVVNASSRIPTRIVSPTTSPSVPSAPFRDLAARLTDPTILSQSAYGVSMQLDVANCSADALGNWPTLVVGSSSGSLPSRVILCPNVLVADGASCPGGSNSAIAELQQRSCLWYLTTTDGSSSTIEQWAGWMAMLRLTYRRLPIQAFATSAQKGRFLDAIKLGWAFWKDRPTDQMTGAGVRWPLHFQTMNVQSGALYVCPSASDTASMPQLSFVDALSACREWVEDAYLATVLSQQESLLLLAARNLTVLRASASASSSSSVWVGLQRNQSNWMNGDAVVFTNWALGQPSAVGPTVVQPAGKWENQVVFSASPTPEQTRNAFCCKRNGFSLRHARYGGVVTIYASTLSLTVSGPTASWSAIHGSRSATVSPSGSASARVTSSASRLTPTRSHAQTVSRVALSLTSTRSVLLTTSAQQTTPMATASWSFSKSLVRKSETATNTQEITLATRHLTVSMANLSVSASRNTMSATMPLPAVARIDWESPFSFLFTAEDIRSGAASRRSIVLTSVFTDFALMPTDGSATNGNRSAARNATLLALQQLRMATSFRLELSSASPSRLRPSAFDFTALGAQAVFLPPSAFATTAAESSSSSFTPGVNEDDSHDLSAPVVTLTLSQHANYYPLADEVFHLTPLRNATTITPDQPPLSGFETLTFTIVADRVDSSAGRRAAATVCAVLSLASPWAARDQQFLYMLGRSEVCSRASSRTMLLDGIRVVSPATWDDTSNNDFALWVGSGAVLGSWIVLHALVWMVRSVTSSSETRKPRDAAVERSSLPSQTAASWLRFPSLSVAVLRMFFVGFGGFSLQILQQATTPAVPYTSSSSWQFIAGIGSVSALLLLTLAIGFGMFWWCSLRGKCMAGGAAQQVSLRYSSFTSDDLRDVHGFPLLIAKRGRWVLSDNCNDTVSTGTVADSLPFEYIWGEFVACWPVVVEWALAWLMAWLVSYNAPSSLECQQAYSGVASALFLWMIVVAVTQPYAASIQNVGASLSCGFLAGVLCAQVIQMDSPDGPSKGAVEILRWFVVGIGILRSIAAVIDSQITLVLEDDPQQPVMEEMVVPARLRSAAALGRQPLSMRRLLSMNPEPQRLGSISSGGGRDSMYRRRGDGDDDDPLAAFAFGSWSRDVGQWDKEHGGGSDAGYVQGEATLHGSSNHNPSSVFRRGSTFTTQTHMNGMDPDDVLSDVFHTSTSAAATGTLDRSRMFSVGSIRRFGSFAARAAAQRKSLAGGTIVVPVVASDGEDSSDGNSDTITPQRRGQRREQQRQPPQQRQPYHPPSPQPHPGGRDVGVSRDNPTAHGQPVAPVVQPSTRPPAAAVRLSPAFSPREASNNSNTQPVETHRNFDAAGSPFFSGNNVQLPSVTTSREGARRTSRLGSFLKDNVGGHDDDDDDDDL